MATVTVDEPTKVEIATVNQAGQLYAGKDLAGKEVEIVLTVKDEG